ncbi:MAG: DUF4113 domain-containing protein, partial [Verrucomicrobia bacterium]|nr:DUF4113 domain-containing protein [Verrucomicrobiota bacterium]
PTKILAKMANRIAKRNRQHDGVFNLFEHGDRDAILREFPMEDVWGIAGRYKARLAALGIHTPLDLKNAPRGWIRKCFGVVMERIALELNGLSCMDLELVPQKRKNMACTRGFGQELTKKEDVAGALAAYVSTLAEKLRKHKLAAQGIHVFLMTNPFNPKRSPYFAAQSAGLEEPTHFTPALAQKADELLQEIFREGYRYKRVGVILLDLIEQGAVQAGLFSRVAAKKADSLMQAVDNLNRRYGRNTVRLGAVGTEMPWRQIADRKTVPFTTDQKFLPVALAD